MTTYLLLPMFCLRFPKQKTDVPLRLSDMGCIQIVLFDVHELKL